MQLLERVEGAHVCGRLFADGGQVYVAIKCYNKAYALEVAGFDSEVGIFKAKKNGEPKGKPLRLYRGSGLTAEECAEWFSEEVG